jgi:hypothetical protein
VPGVPLVGPDGVEGALTLSWAVIFTVSVPEGELTTEVFVAERAWAVTL